ncbi:hypothetical protein [Marinobacterium sediminicola]|uniref:PilZ domain-containing protein n=1 Tax=Marinobacterium sediminicola TaxID=518898 RepID=A0ABY1RWL5_9GAMM|nr:hypothetical protein [Marinobacterium sediminicola]ULG70265.1 hypothetical protein LN244_05480 [Marinobacterium sediminicola]SMR69910.1 hypothetical protein SAMN04487964_101403 [Marinobacterium sediminicola]
MIGPQCYLQHPEQIELELNPLMEAPASSTPPLPLGLLLHCHHYYPSGKWLRIQAPALTEELSFNARVVDCNPGRKGDYLLKLSFPDQEQLFRARMLEQLCQIFIYQPQGPDKDLDQRALEWIEAEAAHFPSNGL